MQQLEIKKLKEIERRNEELSGPPARKNKYENNINIHVIFQGYDSELNNKISPPIVIKCSLNDKIDQLIRKYRERILNFQRKKFIYENKELSPDLTVKEENLCDGCLIKVIKPLTKNDI